MTYRELTILQIPEDLSIFCIHKSLYNTFTITVKDLVELENELTKLQNSLDTLSSDELLGYDLCNIPLDSPRKFLDYFNYYIV